MFREQFPKGEMNGISKEIQMKFKWKETYSTSEGVTHTKKTKYMETE